MQQNFLRISQDSAVTPLRCSWKYDIFFDFVANFTENTTAKELWKSVNNCRSYERLCSGTVFWTRCI